MRVLFYIEPLVMHGRPFHYWAWLAYAADTARALRDASDRIEVRFALNEALATRALAPLDPRNTHAPAKGQALPPHEVIAFSQRELRAPFSLPNIDILAGLFHDTLLPQQVAAMGEVVKQRLGGFEPDVIVTRTPARHLRSAFPRALVLHAELGPFSRAPYGATCFYDPVGMWSAALPSIHAEALRGRTATDDEVALLAQLRENYGAHLDRESPFFELTARLRRKYRRLLLLPLQFGGESGFDMNVPMRTQGEYLLHVLEHTPRDVAVLVTQHPTALWLGDRIDEETQAWLERAHPNARFVDAPTPSGVSQVLVRHVDDVVCVSSSLGLQAIFWQKRLLTVGRSHLSAFADGTTPEELAEDRPAFDPAGREGALGWLMRHYYVPGRLAMHDGVWLRAFFERSMRRHEEGRVGLDFYAPVASDETLERELRLALPPPRATTPLSVALQNGDFSLWNLGDGPHSGSGPVCEGWEVVAGAGNMVSAERVSTVDEPTELDPLFGEGPPPDALRIERTATGDGPSFVLQRVPDVLRLAGATLTLELWARSDSSADLLVYFYLQPDTPRTEARGSVAKRLTLDTTWRCYRYTTTVPGVAREEPLGKNNHAEVALCLPAESGPCAIEVTGARLTQGAF